MCSCDLEAFLSSRRRGCVQVPYAAFCVCIVTMLNLLSKVRWCSCWTWVRKKSICYSKPGSESPLSEFLFEPWQISLVRNSGIGASNCPKNIALQEPRGRRNGTPPKTCFGPRRLVCFPHASGAIACCVFPAQRLRLARLRFWGVTEIFWRVRPLVRFPPTPHIMVQTRHEAMIALYALWMAVEADYNEAEVVTDADPVFLWAEQFFCFFFFVEILIRFGAFKRKCDCLRDCRHPNPYCSQSHACCSIQEKHRQRLTIWHLQHDTQITSRMKE